MATPPPPPGGQPHWPPPGDDAGGGGWSTRTVVAILAVVVVFGALLVGALVAGVFGLFGGVDGITSHIDRANQYLDAARSDPAGAAAMECGTESVTPTASELLATSLGQDLVAFEVDNGRGVVEGTVTLADDRTVGVRVRTAGPTLPTDAGAAEVCVAGVDLGS